MTTCSMRHYLQKPVIVIPSTVMTTIVRNPSIPVLGLSLETLSAD
jgi:hypothetical protein